MQTEFDTIAAISTAPGEGAIGIVRISGDDAIRIADEVYRLKDKRLKEQPSHTINYGHIVDPKNDEVIDEVMVTVLRAPKTFTREDVVEINCHGGIVAINRILQLVLRMGSTPGRAWGIYKTRLLEWTYRLVASRSRDGFDSC